MANKPILIAKRDIKEDEIAYVLIIGTLPNGDPIYGENEYFKPYIDDKK